MSFALATGWDDFEQVAEDFEREVEERQNRVFKPFRFYLKPGKEADIVFLNSIPVPIWEHHLKINGQWGNIFTCLKRVPGEGQCPICASGDRPYRVAFFPIIDLRETTSSKGKTYKNQLRIYPAKMTTATQLRKMDRRLRKKGDEDLGLQFQRFNVSRTASDAVSVGDTMFPEGVMDFDLIEDMLDESTHDDLPWREFLDEKGWHDYIVNVFAAPESRGKLERVVSGRRTDDEYEDDVNWG